MALNNVMMLTNEQRMIYVLRAQSPLLSQFHLIHQIYQEHNF
jgi:hypothetical protein